MEIVKEVLEKAAEKEENLKSTAVKKHLELEYDVGRILAVDTNELDLQLINERRDVYLNNLARGNTQLLINKIWELPKDVVEDITVVKLPVPTFILPREKIVPKPKPLTKWQQFAKEKGIKKKPKGKLQWDETLKKWVPYHGYKRAQAVKEKNWLIEVPDHVHPMTDPFEKQLNEKQEKVAKNEFQRLRNLAKANQVKIPRMGFLTPDKMDSSQLAKAVTVAKASTASLGKFQSKLSKEKEARNVKDLLPSAKKRKAPHLNPSQERKKNMDVINHILNKKPKLDVEKAVNSQIHQEQEEYTQEKQNQKGKGKHRRNKKGKGPKKGTGQGKVAKTKFGAKPHAGKGNRRKTGGRKRR